MAAGIIFCLVWVEGFVMATLTHIAHESLSLPHHEVDWEDIAGSYQHLLIKVAARSDDTTGGTSYLSQFNLRFGNSLSLIHI